MGKKGKSHKFVPEKKGKKKSKKEKEADEKARKDERAAKQEARHKAWEKRQKGRTMVSGSTSWTGKLPAALLHEHCQKQKWNKVQYDMRRIKDGFVATALLSWKNPKTQETISVRMHPPSSLVKPQPTPIEARHYAATYALHRVAFNKNIHMVLPNNHKALWHDLEDFRKQMVKENPNKANLEYTADPFAAVLEKRKKQAYWKKEKEARDAEAMRTKKPTIVIGNKNHAARGRRDADRKMLAAVQLESPLSQVSFPRKVWQNAVMMDLEPRTRVLIDRMIRAHVQISEDKQDGDVDSQYLSLLVDIGFRRSHAEESLKYTTSFEDSLEWLIFHVPEDDLPPVFAKNDEDSRVRLKITNDIHKEHQIEVLCQGSCSKNEASTALDTNDGDMASAAVALTNRLVNFTSQNQESDPHQAWDEEHKSLKAIYGARVTNSHLAKSYEVLLEPEGLVQPGGKHLLSLRIFESPNYPCDICGLQVVVKEPTYVLPKYINVSILTQMLKFLIKDNLIGMPYIYSCIDWLEANISRIIANPGPLCEESLNSTSMSRTSSSISTSGKHKRVRKQHVRVEKQIRLMKEEYGKRQTSTQLKRMVSKRMKLPAWRKMDDLIRVIENNRACIITGETGSGKSTQIVQFILDDLCRKGDFETNIMCTQPRRISAIGLADRVSTERTTKCGEEVGYIIRGENRTSISTRISFVTTGILLRMIQSLYSSDATEKDAKTFFSHLQYIFVDEVHERSIDSDFLLIILKQMIRRFKHLHVVLMSATIDLKTFESFFDYSSKPPAHVHIEGRTFPIEDFYLDSILPSLDFKVRTPRDEIIQPRPDSKYFQDGNINYDLIADLVNYIDRKLKGTDGSILIFLPGVMEINRCLRSISKLPTGNSLFGLPLHSGVSSTDQRKIFRPAPAGKRKIVASTNIAETSVTIPDAVAVIDTGRVKTIRYDAGSDTTKLVEGWSSRAEISQRRGRAGRVRKGLCYRLFTKETEKERMLAQPIPEIKRAPLGSVCLVVKAMGISNVYRFLQEGQEPPSKANVDTALQTLTEIGALHNGSLTALGKYLSLLPTDMKSGKVLLYSTLFGCVDSGVTLASISVTGNPFYRSHEMRDKVKSIQCKYSDGHGDLMAILNVYNEYSKLHTSSEKRHFLDDNCLSWNTMHDIQSTREQYISNLQDMGFLPMGYSRHSENFPEFNRNNHDYSILCAIVTASIFPHIARVQLPDPKFLSSGVGSVAVDPDSWRIKYWIRNEKYIKIRLAGKNPRFENELPATRAFLHPSSTFFSFSGEKDQQISKDDIKMDEEGNYIYSPSAGNSSDGPTLVPTSFIAYDNSQTTTKLYLHDVTPASVMALLLFGGQISYDLSSLNSGRPSPGIVMDGWLPIRTWCKNAVMMTKLRTLLDKFLDARLASPLYGDNSTGQDLGDDVLETIEKVLDIEQC